MSGIQSAGQGLILVSGRGDVPLLAPSAYQVISGKKVQVPVAYSHDSSTFGFVVGEYDHSRQLVIDPLLQTTYLGGGFSFHPQGMVVDQSGDVYVTGHNNLGTWGAPTLYFVNRTVAYVAKINGNLTKFIQISYVGGSCSDSGNALALDSAGDVYLVGTTCSQDLPGVGGGVQQNASIFYGGFVMKLNNALTSIIQATYLSGNSGGDATAIAIDSAGEVYVAGSSGSTVFPGTAGGFQTSPKSSSNTFVSKLNGNLRSVIQSTYYGGSDVDYATSLGLDQSGNVFLAGTTRSDDLPGTAGGARPTFVPVDSSDFADGFVAKFNSGLTSLIQATYIGNVSSWGDFGSMAVAKSGNVYFAGPTASPYIPNTAGGAEPNFTGSFVTELDSGLKTFIQTTYLPWGQGAYVDALGSPVANAIALDSSGNVYVAGGAGNNGFGYSTVVLVSKLSSNLRTAMGAAYLLGGNLQQGGGTTAQSIAIGPTGDVYIAGGTSYPDMMGVQGGAVTQNPGGAAFVSMLTPDLELETSVSASCSPTPIPVNSTTICTAKATGQTPRTSVSPYVSWASNGTGVFSPTACDVSGGSCSVNFTAYSSGHLAITARYDGDFNTPATSITSVVLVMAAATNTTTSSTTTSSTSTSSVSTSTSTVSTVSTTSSTTSTTAATTSRLSSTSQTTSSTAQTTSTTTGSGGIPEFPYQEVAVAAFTVLVVASYLLVRRDKSPGRLAGRTS